jgi:hypothetical protein
MAPEDRDNDVAELPTHLRLLSRTTTVGIAHHNELDDLLSTACPFAHAHTRH